jgi:hypothetical protein
MFRFRKLYMDLVDPSGRVCIAYAAELRTLGLRRRFGGIELYSPGGEREVHRAIEVRWTSSGDELEIQGRFTDGWFSIRHRATPCGWNPEGEACNGLSWRVLGARANAVAKLERCGAARELVGLGYADWVELTKPARFLGLSRVEWGRFHLPDTTFVFSRIHTARGNSWQRALAIQANECNETTEVTIEDNAGLLVCESGENEFVLEAVSVLHDGPVIDTERMPGVLERHLSEFIVGPATERRVVGRTRRSASRSDSPLGWGIAESVRFGHIEAG